MCEILTRFLVLEQKRIVRKGIEGGNVVKADEEKRAPGVRRSPFQGFQTRERWRKCAMETGEAGAITGPSPHSIKIILLF